MNLRRVNRRLLAWLLYCSLLFSALACSIGHGQMAALQLSGLGTQYCSLDGKADAAVDLSGGSQKLLVVSDSGCALSSVFSAPLLAALFGLLGLMPLLRSPPLSRQRQGSTSPRYLWPSANPRASPLAA